MKYKNTPEVIESLEELMRKGRDGGTWLSNAGSIVVVPSKKVYQVVRTGKDTEMLKAVKDAYAIIGWQQVF